MAKDEATETTAAPTELETSLWDALRVFVKHCGGDIANATPEQCEAIREQIEAYAVLSQDDEE